MSTGTLKADGGTATRSRTSTPPGSTNDGTIKVTGSGSSLLFCCSATRLNDWVDTTGGRDPGRCRHDAGAASHDGDGHHLGSLNVDGTLKATAARHAIPRLRTHRSPMTHPSRWRAAGSSLLLLNDTLKRLVGSTGARSQVDAGTTLELPDHDGRRPPPRQPQCRRHAEGRRAAPPTHRELRRDLHHDGHRQGDGTKLTLDHDTLTNTSGTVQVDAQGAGGGPARSWS